MTEQHSGVTWPLTLPLLTGDQVSLRAWELSDAEIRLEAVADPDVLRFTTVPVHVSLDEAKEWVEDRREEAQRGESAYFVIEFGGSAVGSMSLISVDLEEDTAEVGYWLLSSGRGGGRAFEAICLIRDWAISIGFKRLYLTTNLDNLPSQRVARRAGFQAEGIIRSYGYLRDGTREDVILFGMVAPGWEASR